MGVVDNPAPDEELLEGRAWPLWLRALAAFGVAVALVVAVQQVAGSDDSPSVGPSSTEFTRIGPAVPTGAREECPGPALCSHLTTSPRALVEALLERLPGAELRQVRSIEYVSPDNHRVTVWFREILLRAGSAELVVQVFQPQPGDRDSEDAYLIGSRRAVRLQRVFFDRAVWIKLDGTGFAPTLEQLRKLAADVRLVAT